MTKNIDKGFKPIPKPTNPPTGGNNNEGFKPKSK